MMRKELSPEEESWIIEQMADAMIYSDKEGVIRGWNAAAESLFGYAKDEAIGQNLNLIIPERLRDAHWAGFNRAMASSATKYAGRATVTRSLTHSKGTIYVEMSFAVVVDGEGNAVGSVAVARDATQRRENERELKERLETLQKLHPEAK
jgi:PAS domain S-box-containing protein